MTSLPDLIARRADLSPEVIALEDVRSGRTLSYAELDRRAALAAGLMAARSVTPGDRVGLLARNRIAFFELLFGCAKLGAILVPLNWRMPPAELAGTLADAEPKLVFVGEEDEAGYGELGEAPPAILLDRDYEAALGASTPHLGRGAWDDAETWYLLYTSGTTGRPKGVIYTYGMAVANQLNIGSAINLASTDTTAFFLPHFHTSGINLHALPTLLQGGRVLVLPAFEIEMLVELFEARRLDTFFAVPTVYQALLDEPRFRAAPLAYVRHWGCGGAPLPNRLVERSKVLGIRICNGMGMTETGPTMFLADPAAAWERVGSVGKPQLLCSARIVDEAGRDVADGAVGELLFAGPGVTPGYWRDPQATRAAFTADGWLRSGDLGRRDGDGFYHVVGRRKEMFISGGENVYPAEVETVLAAHPAVAEAAVTCAADAYWGEVGRAFLRLNAGVPAPAEPELVAFCRSRLAPYKVPRSFEVVGDFPRTAAGKVQKHLLAADGPTPAR